MASFPDTDFRLLYTGNHGSVTGGGSDWLRDTAFDDRYVQIGDSTTYTAPANGGATTHTHTLTDHTHVGIAHNHSASAGASSGGTAKFASTLGFSPRVAPTSHTHGPTNSNNATIVYANASTTSSATALHPTHRLPIVVGPSDASQTIPDGGVVFSVAESHTGFTKLAWDGSFARTAGTAADANVTEQSAVDSHTGSSHSHTQTAHGHIAVMTTGSSVTISAGITAFANYLHHRAGGITDSPALNDLDNATWNIPTGGSSNLPAWGKVQAFENTSGVDQDIQADMVVGWVGDATGSIPTDYELYSEIDDKQLLCTETFGDIENTGGSNTHTHTSDSHGHVHNGGAGHTHTPLIINTGAALNGNNTSTQPVHLAGDGHTHTWTLGTADPNMNTTVVPVSTDDGRYLYRTMVLLKYNPAPSYNVVKGMGHVTPVTGEIVIVNSSRLEVNNA